MGNKDSVHLYSVAGRHLLSDAEWAWNAKKASIVAGASGNILTAHYNYSKMSWDNLKIIFLKLINQSLIFAIELKPKKAREVLRYYLENSWDKKKRQLEVGLHSPSRQTGYRAAVKDAVSLLDMVVLETPEHTVLMTKKTKSWMHFLRLFSLLPFMWSLRRRASLGWVCGECWQQDQLIEVEIRACFERPFEQPQSTLYLQECATWQFQQTRPRFAHFEGLALHDY